MSISDGNTSSSSRRKQGLPPGRLIAGIAVVLIFFVFVWSLVGPSIPHRSAEEVMLEKIHKTHPEAFAINGQFWGSAEGGDVHPTIVERKRDRLGHIWTITYLNFTPLDLRLSPLQVVGPTDYRHNKDTTIKYGALYHGAVAGDYMAPDQVMVRDVTNDTIVLEKYYEISTAPYTQ